MTAPSADDKIVTLAEISQLFQATDQPRARIARALERLRAIVPYDRCSVVIQRNSGPELIAVPPVVGDESTRVSELNALLREDAALPARVVPAGSNHLALPLVVGDAHGMILVELDDASYEESSLAALSVVSAQLATYIAYCHVVEELQEHVARVEAANAFQQLLVGIVSHDLRNPLASVLAGVTLMGMRAQREQDTQALARVARSTQRAVAIINDLLDMTRGRAAGAFPIAKREGDIAIVVHDVVEELRLVHPARQITIEGGERAILGCFDHDRIAQAIGNLLSNAVQHGSAHTPIEVAVRGTDDEISIGIRNKGLPIEPELLAHLFDPFRRGTGAAATDRRAGRGLGLGLYIVDQIVKAHSGHAIATSSAEGGTELRIVIPRWMTGSPPPMVPPT